MEAEDECDDIPGGDSSLGNPLIGCRPILYIYIYNIIFLCGDPYYILFIFMFVYIGDSGVS